LLQTLILDYNSVEQVSFEIEYYTAFSEQH